MTGDDMRDLFDPEDAAELAASFAQAEQEAMVQANAEGLAADPVLAWRTALSAACTAESVTYVWQVDEGVTVAFALGYHPVRIPDRVLEDLREQGARPEAVACHMKAVSIDPRFASWDEEED